ncbi:hypothetical protein VCRA2118O41_1290001 [Vibrio crassostreae]|nr:hypothetical protein VCRA2118O41_1290001 [Vibrio crassostreae]CAK2255357.1 hypothetical protein VCRA2118O144_890002 [Vibrio crassostreae]CAK2681895.1 hypothetical protein VCRA2119O146_1950001 [Vibrio crassostreae]
MRRFGGRADFICALQRGFSLRINQLIAFVERFNGFIGKPRGKAFGVIDITSDEGDVILAVVGVG